MPARLALKQATEIPMSDCWPHGLRSLDGFAVFMASRLWKGAWVKQDLHSCALRPAVCVCLCVLLFFVGAGLLPAWHAQELTREHFRDVLLRT